MTTQPEPGRGLVRVLLPTGALVALILTAAWLTMLWIRPGAIVADPITTGPATARLSAQALTAEPLSSQSLSAPSLSAPSLSARSLSERPSTAAWAGSSSSPPPSLPPSPSQPPPPQVRVLFGTDSAALTRTAKADLNRVVAYVKATADTFVVVQGRSDSTGSAEAKHRTSVLRAETVEDYLAAMGIPRTRLSHSELSDSAPLKAGTPAAVAAANRSVDVLVKRTA